MPAKRRRVPEVPATEAAAPRRVAVALPARPVHPPSLDAPREEQEDYVDMLQVAALPATIAAQHRRDLEKQGQFEDVDHLVRFSAVHSGALHTLASQLGDGKLRCIGDCPNTVFYKGMCRLHYDLERSIEAKPTVCTEQGCESKIARRKLCWVHYRRLSRK